MYVWVWEYLQGKWEGEEVGGLRLGYECGADH